MPALDAILIGLTIAFGALVVIAIERRRRTERATRRRFDAPAAAAAVELPEPAVTRPETVRPNRLVVSAPRPRVTTTTAATPAVIAPVPARRAETAWFVRTMVFATVAVLSLVASAVLLLQPQPKGGVLGATGTPAPTASAAPTGSPSSAPSDAP